MGRGLTQRSERVVHEGRDVWASAGGESGLAAAAAVHSAHIATNFLMEAISATVRRVVGVLSWLVVAGLYGTLAWATFRMLDVVHDEKTPILQLPGSLTYGCVMVGMALLAGLALQSAWQASRIQPEPSPDAEPHVPTAHW